MHNSMRVSVFESLKDLKRIEADIHRIKLVVQLFGLYIGNIFKHETWRLCLLVAKHVVQFHNIGAAIERV